MNKILKFESFEMNKSTCDRCGENTNGTTIMSVFNTDIICMKCKEEERNDPDYKKASDAEIESVKNGVKDYKGYIPNYKPIKLN